MTKPIIGIDVSKLTLDVVLIQDSVAKYALFKNDSEGHRQIMDWSKKQVEEKAQVCMEATGQYGLAAAKYLHSHGFEVSVVNPARIKAYAVSKLKRNKTDKADAKLIAEFCQKEKPDLWTPSPAHFLALKALIYRLDDLKNMKQQEKNRTEFEAAHPVVNDDLQEHLYFLNMQIKKVQRTIHTHIQAFPDLKHLVDLLISIPGIGEITAAWIISEIHNLHEFSNTRQITAFVGLNPKKFVSGSSIHKKPRLSKTGNANLRKALFMPAIVAMNHNPIIMAFSKRLLSRGLPKMAVVGASMRKLLCLAYGVVKNQKPFDPDFLNKLVFIP
jgi:transposase